MTQSYKKEKLQPSPRHIKRNAYCRSTVLDCIILCCCSFFYAYWSHDHRQSFHSGLIKRLLLNCMLESLCQGFDSEINSEEIFMGPLIAALRSKLIVDDDAIISSSVVTFWWWALNFKSLLICANTEKYIIPIADFEVNSGNKIKLFIWADQCTACVVILGSIIFFSFFLFWAYLIKKK